MHAPLAYAYTHVSTEATTGYFSCEPTELTPETALERLEETPLDTFLHQYVLRQCTDEASKLVSKPASEPASTLEARIRQRAVESAVCAALALELDCLRSEKLLDLPALSSAQWERVLAATPLPYLAWWRHYASVEQIAAEQAAEQGQDGEYALIAAWRALFADNLLQQHSLPHPDDSDLPLPRYVQEAAAPYTLSAGLTVADAYRLLRGEASLQIWSRPPAQDTAAQALANLASYGVIAGVEMRHESSLSPIGLLRKWQVDVCVRDSRLHYTVQGEANTWGRGLCLADARASYAMEMVERASAYLSVVDGAITDRVQPTPVIRAAYSALVEQGRAAYNPNWLPLETPYRDQVLYWMEGHDAHGQTVLVPVQAVGLFCNLDEPDLLLAPSSTGLASGNTLDEAKVGALTEILERDAEATVPWRRGQCFTLRINAETAEQEHLAALLADYAQRGIQVYFRDMPTEFSLPCFQAIVSFQDGRLARGTGAGLSAARALIAALTETPYPYPHGEASAPVLSGLPERDLASFPDYRLDSPARNVALLERVLLDHGRVPVYVPLTREDLEFPVVRALIPGLELSTDTDRFTRPAVRLMQRYMEQA